MILKELKITSGLLLSACLAANVNGQVINSQDSSIRKSWLRKHQTYLTYHILILT